MISENRTSASEFTKVDEYISPRGVSFYQGAPLVVLVNSLTCSGGEMLLLMLQQASGYKSTIGTPTQGCAGTIIDRELPNGWIFRFTSSRTSEPDGREYFKVGIRPTTINTDTDAAFNAAVTILK